MNCPDTPRTLRLAQLAAALSLALPNIHAFAANRAATPNGGPIVVVQNCDDSGSGSLRDAYENLAAQGTTIDLSQLACSTITLASELFSGPGTLLVTVKGPMDHSLTLDGGGNHRVFHHGGNLYLRDLVITHGGVQDSSGGGCILTNNIQLERTTISNCTVSTSGSTDARGGAIRATNNAFIIASRINDNSVHSAAGDADGGGVHAGIVHVSAQSTISGNTASGDGSHYARGGGIFSENTLSITDSTVSDNHAISGGGVFTHNAMVGASLILNSTIANNRADGAAGGIFNGHSTIALGNSTISGNSAVFEFGAGLYLADGDADLRSTIIANNTTGGGLNLADIAGHAGAVITGDHNLVTASTLTLPADTFQQDPLLGPLQDNGGGVFTQALLPGSPALDTGLMGITLANDQRGPGFARVWGSAIDIGAFEHQVIVDHIFSSGFEAPLL
jgi:hypothetical protein